MRKHFYILALLCLFFVPQKAVGQGGKNVGIAFRYTPSGVQLSPGATITVCATSASIPAGGVCVPPENDASCCFIEPTLTTHVASNPFFADSTANYFFYAAPGSYLVCISGSGVTPRCDQPTSPTQVACIPGATGCAGGGGGGAPGAPTNSLQKNNGAGGFSASNTTDTGTVTTVAGTTENIDADTHFKGPNPYNDVARYGASSSTSATTASCTNTSTTVTLAAALDFQDATAFPGTGVGNGIVLYKCGAATGLTTPPAPTVTPYQVTGGATTYNYKYVAEDQQGGLTAASAQGTTTTGASALGLTTVNLTVASWNSTLNGEQVYTCSGNCNIAVNTPIRIDGFANNHFDGNYTVIATNGTNQFTVYSPVTPLVTSESIAATAKVLACNLLTMPANTTPGTVEGGSGDSVLRYIIYRNNVLAGYAQSRDPYYEDCGVTATQFPSYMPASPGSAVNKYLATTIVSGGGTTSITVANAAGATVGGVTALHDNSKNTIACLHAAVFSSPCYLSVTGPFNAATIFAGATVNYSKMLLPYGASLNQPWVLPGTNGVAFEGGMGNGATSFQFENIVNVGNASFAFPTVLITQDHPNNSLSGLQFKNIVFNNTQLGGIAFVTDIDVGALFGLQMNNVGFGSTGNTANVNFPAARFSGIQESSIGMPGNRNSCTVPQITPGPPCMRFTTVSVARNSGANGNASLARDVQINGFAVQGGGASYQFDTLPWTNSGGTNPFGAADIRFVDGLREVGKGPFLRDLSQGSFYFKYLDDDAPNFSVGNGWVDAAYTNKLPSGYDFEQISSSVFGQVAVAGPGTVTFRGSVFLNGAGTTGTAFSSSANGSGNISTIGTGSIAYTMPAPGAPGLAAAAGTNIAAGTHAVALAWFDANGRFSVIGPTASITTVGGTQNINVTPPAAPPGAMGYEIVIDGSTAANGVNCNFVVVSPATTVATNVFAPICAGIIPNDAAQSSLTSAGVQTNQLVLTGGFKDTHTGAFTVNRTTTWPDVSGYVPVTSYVNSAYDNFNRANGGLGANWTTFNGGSALQITSNQVQLPPQTNAHDASGYTGQTFSANQFGEVTMLTPSNADTFLQITILLRMTGVNGAGYGCVWGLANTSVSRYVSFPSVAANLANTGAGAWVAGDVLRCEIQDSTIKMYKNGVLLVTNTDSTVTAAGSVGIDSFDGTAANSQTLDNFSNGNLHPLAQLDTEQDWMQPQHFTAGVVVGLSTDPAVLRYGRYSAAQSPAIVGANTCAAQSLTFTGLRAGDILIAVNKPTEQAGLSVTPGHVTGANTATLNFCNNTGAGITPTAAETYNVIAVQ